MKKDSFRGNKLHVLCAICAKVSTELEDNVLLWEVDTDSNPGETVYKFWKDELANFWI